MKPNINGPCNRTPDATRQNIWGKSQKLTLRDIKIYNPIYLGNGTSFSICHIYISISSQTKNHMKVQYLSIFISSAFFTLSRNDLTACLSVPGFFFPWKCHRKVHVIDDSGINKIFNTNGMHALKTQIGPAFDGPESKIQIERTLLTTC